MVSRSIKIPKHGGPDGVGLTRPAIDHLINMLDDATISDSEIKIAIELCLTACTQAQWNDEYRVELLKRLDT